MTRPPQRLDRTAAQLRTLGTPAGVTPVALASARGYDECAAVLAALAGMELPLVFQGRL